MTAELDREKLRAAREEKHLSQETLAERSGISDRHLRNLENRKVNLSAAVLWQLSRALGTTMDALMIVYVDEDGES